MTAIVTHSVYQESFMKGFLKERMFKLTDKNMSENKGILGEEGDAWIISLL